MFSIIVLSFVLIGACMWLVDMAVKQHYNYRQKAWVTIGRSYRQSTPAIEYDTSWVDVVGQYMKK